VTDDAAAAPRYTRLLPAPGAELTVAQALGDWGRDGRHGAGVALNMVASADGRIAVGGRSGPLGSPADHALFHALRARADAVMAGAGTVRVERYGPVLRDPRTADWRREQGLRPQPLAVIVSRSLEIDPTVPLLADPDSQIVVVTPSDGELPDCAASIRYVRAATLRDGLAELRSRWSVTTILCEGGPHLNGGLAAEGLIDEMFLTITPLLVGDIERAGAVVLGGAPARPLALAVRVLLASSGQLFAHYVAA